MSWRRAAAVSCLAVHGPFLVMAVYTLIFVSCSHCKGCAWKLLACAPGLLPVEAVRQGLDLPGLDDGLLFSVAGIVSAGMVLLLASLIRQNKRARLIGIALASILSSVFAFCTLAVIRA